ncbi:hypothetical protein FRB98_004314 [Tulasnella sp. 332]|nr:hypothetical protein FRB98_004314 [Tulasnella sp. 332]
MSNHYHHHQQPAFYGTIPAGGELAEALAQTSSSDGAVSSLGDEPLNESDMGRSNDLSDTAMEVGSVADSEISSLYPCDSISQRGEQVEHPPPSETKGEDSASDIHSFISEVYILIRAGWSGCYGQTRNASQLFSTSELALVDVDDANLSMAHYKDCFDVVHVRAADQGINDYKGFIYEIARTIRPHGILILCMANPRFTIAVLLESMQHFIGKGLDETETWVAEAMKINLMHAFEAFRPLLLTDGISPEDVEVMVQGATAELRDQTVHAVIQWKYCTAIRRDIHWHERLEVAEPLNRATETLIVDPSPPGTKSVAARSVGFPPKKG